MVDKPNFGSPSPKQFTSITQSECRTAYTRILHNSDELWRSAESLADSQRYGHASSLHIISIEELIKATLVFFDGKGFKFRKVRGINVFFRNHQIRYLISFMTFMMGVFGDDIGIFIKTHLTRPDGYIYLNDLLKDQEKLEKKARFWGLRKLVLFKREYKWFSRMDSLRQKGFYFDFGMVGTSPQDFKMQDYRYLLGRLDKVRDMIKGVIKTFENPDPEMANSIIRLKQDHINDLFYQRMSRGLLLLRQKSFSPFKGIEEIFQEHFPEFIDKSSSRSI